MKKVLALPLVGYLAAITWLGYLAADPFVREAFEGKGYVLVGLLGALYGVVTSATYWLVSFLSKFSFKLASGASYAPGVVGAHVHTLLVLALVSRIPALVGQQFWHTNAGIVTLLVPLAAAVLAAVRNRALRPAAKGLAYLPFALYLCADAVVLATMGRA